MSSVNEFVFLKKRLSVFDPYGSNSILAKNNQSVLNKKPITLHNIATKNETLDMLHNKTYETTLCTQQSCLGSCMTTGRLQRQPQIRSSDEILAHAKDFLEQYFTSIKRLHSAAHLARLEQVQKDIKSIGTYQLTETELTFGAKLAWRNATRCIGRIQWSKLQVFDCRYVTTTTGMFEALCNHIKYATNKGNIRSAITIFPQRTDSNHDYRVWNSQLISYAGYRQEDGTIIGDPMNVEFTEICLKLGWKSPRTNWDILPLVLSANGHDPDYFDLPPDLILQVPLSHPKYSWFEELNLKWYALPAVSSLMFDCGGLEFTAAPFNGWYMSTEIGCRNLCDNHRLNLLETLALKMNLDTRTPVTLWKDQALIECNIAVLHSFQKANVIIVDHHTASESFMKFLENESRLRSGCPADWIWIVPPMSASTTPVFHQEMIMYFLKPSYEYQEAAWKTHVWKKGREQNKVKKSRRKFHFKQIARAVKFTSKLFGKALSRRIKATVLYATETGKSESYAKKLCEIFSHAFNAQVYCMLDYDISSIEHETLLLVVTSTFGNGDPPENGELFAQNLYSMKLDEESEYLNGYSHTNVGFSKSFIRANSNNDLFSDKQLNKTKNDSFRLTITNEDHVFGPLSNIRYAVFSLGSSAYPNFCAFGRYVDNLLNKLGGERLYKMEIGDEMCGQEQSFHKWAIQIFRIACETFCLDEDSTYIEPILKIQCDSFSKSNVRVSPVKPMPLDKLYMKCFNKTVFPCKLIKKTNLHGGHIESKVTMLFEFTTTLIHKPGDHVGIFARNRQELVNEILEQLDLAALGPDFSIDQTIELQILRENHTFNGIVKTWEPHERLPVCSLRELFSRFLDITTPPSPNLLQYFATIATDSGDRDHLTLLATNEAEYEDWKYWNYPNLIEVLKEFPSVKPHPLLLVLQLNILQPRFYSISSSLLLYPDEIHLTVAIVTYITQNGAGPIHYGVCSNFLKDLVNDDIVYMFVRSSPNFYLPTTISSPIILVGPGTGIAPFRSFWQERYVQKRDQLIKNDEPLSAIWLFFGCRTIDLDLFRNEKDEMLQKGVLSKSFLALSRQRDTKKSYVQDLILLESKRIYKFLAEEQGHFYVCGDCTMAEDVYQTLKLIIKTHSEFDDKEVDEYMFKLRDENRYHEDIFGITLRTTEVHNKSREYARIKTANKP